MMNKVYTHPGQPQMQVEVILASQLNQEDWTGDGEPPILYTIRLRYPRIIHSEIMTHRDFSRNARSSRAVPVKTMLLETTSIPFMPWHWGKNQKGMQAGEECNELVEFIGYDPEEGNYGYGLSREGAWLKARDAAVEVASAMMEAGYHKQNVNRLLEPFAWIDTLITATNWNNFIHLRDHKDAEPHLQDLARLVGQAIKECYVQQLSPGGWHLPYVSDAELGGGIAEWAYNNPDIDVDDESHTLLLGVKISAARCARISYAPFDGNASYERELERYDELVKSDRVHASPLEHQAEPDTLVASINFSLSDEQVDRVNELNLNMDDEIPFSLDITRADISMEWENKHCHGNLRGFIQYRKLVRGEYVDG